MSKGVGGSKGRASRTSIGALSALSVAYIEAEGRKLDGRTHIHPLAYQKYIEAGVRSREMKGRKNPPTIRRKKYSWETDDE